MLPCSFSTFVAAVIRTLVGFYDISYSDGLAVCGAVAREMLSYGEPPPRPELLRPDVRGHTSIIAQHLTAMHVVAGLAVRAAGPATNLVASAACTYHTWAACVTWGLDGPQENASTSLRPKVYHTACRLDPGLHHDAGVRRQLSNSKRANAAIPGRPPGHHRG